MTINIAIKAYNLHKLYCQYGDSMCYDNIYEVLVMEDLIYFGQYFEQFADEMVGNNIASIYLDLLISDVWAIAPKYKVKSRPITDISSSLIFLPRKLGGLGCFAELVQDDGYIPYIHCFPNRTKFNYQTSLPASNLTLKYYKNNNQG